MAAKAEPIGARNGHELAPLTTRAEGGDRPHGVTIVLQVRTKRPIKFNLEEEDVNQEYYVVRIR